MCQKNNILISFFPPVLYLLLKQIQLLSNKLVHPQSFARKEKGGAGGGRWC